MKWNCRIIYKIIVIAAILYFFGLFSWLLINKIVIGNDVVFSTDFSQPDYFVQGLFPVGRVDKFKMGAAIVERVLYDPVYFDVYSPRHFNKAIVTLQYEKPTSLDVSVGVKLKGGEWSYDLKKLTENNEQAVEFDLRNAELQNNKLQFIISAPKLTVDDELIVKGATFQLIK